MNWRCWTITGKFQRLAKPPWQSKSGSTLRHVSIKHQPQQSNGLHALRKPPDQLSLSVSGLNMSSRTSSGANWKFSSTFPHNWINCAGKAFSYLQFHDSFSSFHAADLVHNQFIQIFMLEIYFFWPAHQNHSPGNLTRYCAIIIGLSEISRSIYIDQNPRQIFSVDENHFLTIIHHVTVMLVCGRSEGKFPVKISVKELDVNEICCMEWAQRETLSCTIVRENGAEVL